MISQKVSPTPNSPLTVGSVCSGIGAPECAWRRLGWHFLWQAEIEAAPSAVLRHHFPGVPNLGDMTLIADKVRSGHVAAPDILVGGTPCQDFSVAGLRAGLAGIRGNLAMAFVDLANAIDAVRRAAGKPPAFILWENVPGVFSDDGNAFGSILGGLVGSERAVPAGPDGGWDSAGVVDGPDRCAAWRILDAQHFGVAQRRRRVFVLARGGADRWACADALLPLIQGVCWHPAPRRGTQTSVAAALTASSGRRCGKPNGGQTEGHLIAFNAREDPDVSGDISGPLGSSLPQAQAVALRGREGGATIELGDDLAFTLRASTGGGDKPHVLTCETISAASSVRRIMPVEAERLQGFPDGWTAVPAPCRNSTMADSPRYQMLGNSMAVPVLTYIGERIEAERP